MDNDPREQEANDFQTCAYKLIAAGQVKATSDV